MAESQIMNLEKGPELLQDYSGQIYSLISSFKEGESLYQQKEMDQALVAIQKAKEKALNIRQTTEKYKKEMMSIKESNLNISATYKSLIATLYQHENSLKENIKDLEAKCKGEETKLQHLNEDLKQKQDQVDEKEQNLSKRMRIGARNHFRGSAISTLLNYKKVNEEIKDLETQIQRLSQDATQSIKEKVDKEKTQQRMQEKIKLANDDRDALLKYNGSLDKFLDLFEHILQLVTRVCTSFPVDVELNITTLEQIFSMLDGPPPLSVGDSINTSSNTVKSSLESIAKTVEDNHQNVAELADHLKTITTNMKNSFSRSTFSFILENEMRNPFVGKRTIRIAVEDTYNQKGFRLTCHQFYNEDKRDSDSNYACVHRHAKDAQQFALIRVDNYYRIVLINDDTYKQSKWMLTCHRFYDRDKRDGESTYVCLHKNPVDGQLWDIRREGDYVLIVQVDTVFNQNGWYLTAHRQFKTDERDNDSSYLCLHKERKQGQLWEIL